MAEDIPAQEITDKGLDFAETFSQVHQGYVRNRTGQKISFPTVRVDNLPRVEDIRAIGSSVLSHHEFRGPELPRYSLEPLDTLDALHSAL